ncbi:Gfo/Idh/MocA family oxidoreductase [Frankia sp. Ag45/Mut15]|uniref:Gfo/Idh/MocA family oxidoreductase n=1 Tax=Frankia umida TaxID=573489 RepID=A0ABT0JWN8_9ACTN|nr:Gfo/Idh/MocA family oxidoreductase [Frankia umida]MCK9875418.1 Gfo/Idh/MocA family oxidoreductase [Frankia umida]
MPRIHLVSNLPGVNVLGDHLRAAGLGPTSARSADALLVLIDRPLDHVEQELLDRARQSVPVLLAGPTARALPPGSPLLEASGLTPGRVLPAHDLHLMPGPHGGALMARAPRFVPRETWVLPEKVADDVERLIHLRHDGTEHAVCTWRPATGLGMFTLGAGPAVLADSAYHRLVGRWLRHCLGVPDGPPVLVGLLGLPDTTAVHQPAIEATEGLALTAVCDGEPRRTPAHAASRLPRQVDDPDDLVHDPELDLVVVATGNQSHLDWASRALEAGKHVVVQAPLCLAPADADHLAELAAAQGRVLAVVAAGRSDPGFEVLAAAVRRGAIGEPLRLEAYRGGWRRPTGGWRDDAAISGGQLFAQATGAVEQILALVDESVESVTATAFKRVWHHVSNADHSSLTLRFLNGAQAQITVSDLTVWPRPRLEVLGTTGSLLLDVDRGEHDVAGFAAAGALAPAGRHTGGPPVGMAGFSAVGGLGGLGGMGEAGAGVLQVTADGVWTRYPIPLLAGTALDGGALGGGGGAAAFYGALADRLVSGWPLSADVGLATARPVVSVLAAAVRSAATGGEPVTPA